MVTQTFQNGEEQELVTTSDRVVDISRVAKVVKGGRHLSFRALVVVGDSNGHVSAGIGKADAIPDAVRKATSYAQKTLFSVSLRGSTIPHTVRAKFGAALVMLKPAPVGTGIIAGTSMRAVLELAGVKDVVAKSFRSQNPMNVIRATLEALKDLTPAPDANQAYPKEALSETTPTQDANQASPNERQQGQEPLQEPEQVETPVVEGQLEESSETQES